MGTPLIVKVRSITGEEHDICVRKNTSLRDMQETLCRLFRMPFPKTKACIAIGNRSYDEFVQRPFVDCCGGDVMTVVFTQTDDPYFYDMRDRVYPRHRKPSLQLEQALAAARLRLPPTIVFE